MKFRKSEIVSLLIVIASFAIGWYLYPALPEKMASHWNAAGQVDGYMGKFWGVFFMPFISVAILILLVVMPKLDPRSANIEKFRRYFDNFIILILLFFLYIYALTLAWNLGRSFNMARALVPAFAILFFYAGVLIGHAEPNWTIGIRTPWTLSSESVWKKTHKLGAKLFWISAAIAVLGVFFPSVAIWLVIIPVVFSSFISFLYSYLEFKKEKRLANPKSL